jgi:hypothetical protein
MAGGEQTLMTITPLNPGISFWAARDVVHAGLLAVQRVSR